MPSRTPRQLVIAGFHRSGTSMTAQWLRNAGLPLGVRLNPPDPSNPDGHFEDMDIVEWHVAVLRDNSSNWLYDRPAALAVGEARLAQLRALAAERDRRFPQWGFKDPRCCLCLDAWMDGLSNPYVLAVYRHFGECYRSILQRAARHIALNPQPGYPGLRFWSDPELILRMWLTHNQALLRCARRQPDRILAVSQPGLLAGFPLTQELGKRFGFVLDGGADSGVKPDLPASESAGPAQAEPALAQALAETWAALNTLAVAPAPSPVPDARAKPAQDIPFGEIEAIIGGFADAVAAELPQDPEQWLKSYQACAEAGRQDEAAACYRRHVRLRLGRPGYLGDLEASLRQIDDLGQRADLLRRVGQHLRRFAAEP